MNTETVNVGRDEATARTMLADESEWIAALSAQGGMSDELSVKARVCAEILRAGWRLSELHWKHALALPEGEEQVEQLLQALEQAMLGREAAYDACKLADAIAEARGSVRAPRPNQEACAVWDDRVRAVDDCLRDASSALQATRVSLASPKRSGGTPVKGVVCVDGVAIEGKAGRKTYVEIPEEMKPELQSIEGAAFIVLTASTLPEEVCIPLSRVAWCKLVKPKRVRRAS